MCMQLSLCLPLQLLGNACDTCDHRSPAGTLPEPWQGGVSKGAAVEFNCLKPCFDLPDGWKWTCGSLLTT